MGTRTKRRALVALLTLGMLVATACQPDQPARRITHPGDPGASQQVQVDPTQVAEVQKAVDAWIAVGQPTLAQLGIVVAQGCNGVNAYYTYDEWYSGHVQVVALDSCSIQTLRNALSLGSSFAALFTMIAVLTGAGAPIAVLSGFLGTLGAIGNAALGWCSQNGNGTDIRYNSSFGYGWCNNQ